MKIKNAKDFTPTYDMIQAVKAVFVCMAAVETIKPIVRGYQEKILAYMQAGPAEKWCQRENGMKPDDIILAPEQAYLLDDDDWTWYLAECNKERKKAKLHVENEEFCPLLVAENNLRKARKLLIDAMEPLTGIKFDDLFTDFPNNYNKYIDLSLRLLVSFLDPKAKAGN